MEVYLKEYQMPLKNFKCDWCGNEFKQFVWYSQGESDPHTGAKGKKSSVSTQVRCPRCLRLIPTWPRIRIGDKLVKVRK